MLAQLWLAYHRESSSFTNLNFGETYLVLFGFKFFEPMVILTNTVIFILGLVYFMRLWSFNTPYLKQMALFIFCVGISTLVGAVGHAVHKQLGEIFFNVILFLMNAFSLFSMYFCFRASYIYANGNKKFTKNTSYLISLWIVMVLIACAITGDFIIIKTHALIVVAYALVMHYRTYRKTRDKGGRFVTIGLLISVLSVVVHSLKLSLGEWFNYKDISHVIMIISLVVIYHGTRLIAKQLQGNYVTI